MDFLGEFVSNLENYKYKRSKIYNFLTYSTKFQPTNYLIDKRILLTFYHRSFIHMGVPLIPSARFSLSRPRKPSLKEQPSYLKEVSIALTRREELFKLRERMSSARLLLEADPSTKPWLSARSISSSSIYSIRKMSSESNTSVGEDF